MFKKVLISEDHESINISVQRTLEDLKIQNFEHVFYCDDALAKIKKSIRENQPFDLLITDLYYEEDHYTQKINHGTELIDHARELLPELKIIVFSAEHKSSVIDALFTDRKINGYVRKARNDSKEIKKAITEVYAGKNYLSANLRQDIKQLNNYEFSAYDVTLIGLLAEGVMKKDLPVILQSRNISPNGISSVEKKLSKLKEGLGVNSNEHLIAFCKDLGII